MGLIVVVSSPSGAGKTTLVNALLAENKNYARSVSYTSRPRNKGEQNGRDYHFVSGQKFAALLKDGFFVEAANVHGYFYGTAKSALKSCLRGKKDVFFVIDVKGGLAVKKMMPEAVLVFIAPPSIKELNRRIYNRSREPVSEIKKRMLRVNFELQKARLYDYCIINKNIPEAVRELECVIRAQKNLLKYQKNFVENLLKQGGNTK